MVNLSIDGAVRIERQKLWKIQPIHRYPRNHFLAIGGDAGMIHL